MVSIINEVFAVPKDDFDKSALAESFNEGVNVRPFFFFVGGVNKLLVLIKNSLVSITTE